MMALVWYYFLLLGFAIAVVPVHCHSMDALGVQLPLYARNGKPPSLSYLTLFVYFLDCVVKLVQPPIDNRRVGSA
ncbi:hypothetical protein MUK42_28545 [Musa troglodytarum]|uniref:Secreted peptide n=1 Tax=Musa troglodytarum TaxID=320322 RepID=A0A9E7GAH8_9LILI|nr:hypothetical protein MUK42_28545 [Musa troglodytarum]